MTVAKKKKLNFKYYIVLTIIFCFVLFGAIEAVNSSYRSYLINNEFIEAEALLYEIIDREEYSDDFGYYIVYDSYYTFFVGNDEYEVFNTVDVEHESFVPSRLIIYYNPNDPNDYVLDKHIVLWNIWAFVIFTAILFIYFLADAIEVSKKKDFDLQKITVHENDFETVDERLEKINNIDSVKEAYGYAYKYKRYFLLFKIIISIIVILSTVFAVPKVFRDHFKYNTSRYQEVNVVYESVESIGNGYFEVGISYNIGGNDYSDFQTMSSSPIVGNEGFALYDVSSNEIATNSSRIYVRIVCLFVTIFVSFVAGVTISIVNKGLNNIFIKMENNKNKRV